MVFQSYAVFPHMTVFDNIAFGLKMQRVDRSQIKKRVESVAELLHIEELLKRYPAQLSGGQRQRVAVARAIVLEPEVLLMDEPLSNLDALIRLQVRADLKRLHREIGSTTVYVTHDQVEALSLGDRIAVMKDGEIVQVDDPTRVYEEPADLFVGGFIGNPPMNFLKGTVHADGDRVRVELGDLKLEPPSAIAPLLRERHGEQVIIGIRAENILIEDRPTQDGLQATVLVVEPLGSHKLLTLRACGETLKAMVRPDLKIEPNREVWLRFETEKIRWLDGSSGRSLAHIAFKA
jgi:multiple sugar transport system ATP-binding protein